jgi:photosystem II stability/assembly factor-like uncharacterized protein
MLALSRPISLRLWLAPLALVSWLIAGCSSSQNPVAPTPMPPLSSLKLAIKVDTLQAGVTKTYVATAKDTLGAVVGNPTFAWTSTNPAAFTVDTHGNVHGVSEGSGLLIASASGLADTASITVIVQRGWFVQSSGTSSDLNGVFFLPNGQTGWAVGAAGRIITTANAGNSWSTQTSNTGVALNGVWFTSASEGWAVGAGGTVVHTSDAGVTWAVVPANASEVLNDVWFATPDTGWVVGKGGLVLRTFDHGASWQRQTPTTFDLNSVSFSGTMDGWAVGSAGVILGTHDRGLSWYIVQPAITGQPLNAVWRRSASAGWAAGQAGVTPRNVANADSSAWELDNAGASYVLQGLCYATDLIGFAVGTNGGNAAALRTDDGGVSWQAETPATGFGMKDVYFINANSGWAVGKNGTVLHTSTGGLP